LATSLASTVLIDRPRRSKPLERPRETRRIDDATVYLQSIGCGRLARAHLDGLERRQRRGWQPRSIDQQQVVAEHSHG
jgi:hypothetical protein